MEKKKMEIVAFARRSAITLLATTTALAIVACGSGESSTSSEGDATKGSTSGTACVNGACGGSGAQGGDASSGDGNSGPSDACPDISEGNYPMSAVGAGSTCDGFDPGTCGVVQSGCAMTVECDSFPQVTVTMNSEGVSDKVSVPVGDGVVADCFFDWKSTLNYDLMHLTCSAGGVTCKWTSG